MQKKILIIGKGFLGSYLAQEASSKFDVVCTQLRPTQSDVKTLDVTDFEQVKKIISSLNPDYVVNCSVRGDVDNLQNNRELAYAVNSQGPKNIATACQEGKIRLVHVSTDSIFDGKRGNYTEKDTPNPINVYAESKLSGELQVSNTAEDYVIARTNFYGIDHRQRYFFNWILNSLKEKKEINGFTDVIFSPLDVSTLAKMITELLQTRYTGILHLSSGNPVSKYDFIIKVAELLGCTTENIHASSIDDVKMNSPRPKNTSLDNKIALDLLKTPIPTIEKWIKENREEILSFMR